jgi:protein-disulfide isomerase
MNAPVTLLEYGDFECPYCGQAYYVIKEIEEDMGTQLRRVFRHFPLSTIHPHAESAALASEAAAAQGKFWEMHDILFENQDALEDEDLAKYALALDLDLTLFDEAMKTRAALPRIKEDFLSGVRSGVNGTPTFFINGVRHDGSFELPVLYQALKQAAAVKAQP